MMNMLALGLVLSSLAAAGVWSPNPDKPPAVAHDNRHTTAGVVKEGHRLIVIEYERLVPLQTSDHTQTSPSSIIHEAREKLKEAASVLPNVGQGISVPTVEGGKDLPTTHVEKEKICDAYGVCKDKISGLFGKTKEKASHLEDATKEATDRAMHKAMDVKEEVEGAANRARHKVMDVKEGVEEAAAGAMHKAAGVKGNISGVVEHGMDKARNVSEKAAEAGKNLTDILRRGRDVVYDAAAYIGARETMEAVMGVAELVAFATAYGTCVWVTFVSSHVLARALPRQQFGIVQSRLYPVYFRAMTYTIGVAFLTHFFGLGGRRGSVAEKVQGYNLLAALGLVLANMLLLEPKATKVMFERMKMEKEEGRGRDMADVMSEPAATAGATSFGSGRAGTVERPAVDQEAVKSRMAKLNRKLKNLNSYSSLLNIVTLMSLTWHLVHLSRKLQQGTSAC